MLREYITKNGKKLRYGYTTGTCATAAAKACGIMLFEQKEIKTVCLKTPKGIELELDILNVEITENTVICAIKKDSGDDPDITNGMLIYAKVSKIDTANIVIDGGVGIGRVTKAGLNQSVGNAAINSVPRSTIKNAMLDVAEDYNYSGGFNVEVFAPQGVELAKKTYNSRLGIMGGLSILGTTGIVEPMSESAIVDTIFTELNVRYEHGKKYLLLTPGNYGNDFIKANYTLNEETPIKCSNFIGDAIDYAVEKGFKNILIIGHGGKLIKLACGMFNTHSKFGDCRAEVIATYSALNNAPKESLDKILNSVTCDEMILETQKLGIQNEVLAKVMERIDFHINARVHGAVNIGAIVFTDKLGILGKTEKAEMLLKNIELEN